MPQDSSALRVDGGGFAAQVGRFGETTLPVLFRSNTSAIVQQQLNAWSKPAPPPPPNSFFNTKTDLLEKRPRSTGLHQGLGMLHKTFDTYGSIKIVFVFTFGSFDPA